MPPTIRVAAATTAMLFIAACFPVRGEREPTAVVDEDDDGYEEDDDCNDEEPSVHPGAEEIPYDGVDQDCDGVDPVDLDGDGWDAVQAGGFDCDDEDSAVHPDADEIPYDGIDNDCEDGDLLDADGDGFDSSEFGGDDCDDADPDVHPGVFDGCGGGDEDCDGNVDEDDDQDGDGFGVCDGDCDDSDETIHPDADDIPMDGIDQDCTGKDQGNCSAWVYEQEWTLLFTLGGGGSCSPSNCGGWSVTEAHSFHMPEDATCVGGDAIIYWTASYSIGNASVSGDWDLSTSSGCGEFTGSGSYSSGNGTCSCSNTWGDLSDGGC